MSLLLFDMSSTRSFTWNCGASLGEGRTFRALRAIVLDANWNRPWVELHTLLLVIDVGQKCSAFVVSVKTVTVLLQAIEAKRLLSVFILCMQTMM